MIWEGGPRRRLTEKGGIAFVHFDQLDEVLDAEVGERHDAVFSDPLDPDHPILDFHFIGDVRQPVFAFAEVLGDTMDGGDMMDLVDVHDQAARAVPDDTSRVQFQGNSSSSRWTGWAAMRERTLLSHACGSKPFILAVTIRLYMDAAGFVMLVRLAGGAL